MNKSNEPATLEDLAKLAFPSCMVESMKQANVTWKKKYDDAAIMAVEFAKSLLAELAKEVK